MKKSTLIKFAKLLAKFEDIQTEEGAVLTVEGDLEVGKEVYVTDENGEIVPATDGTYTYDGKTIVVAEGKIGSINDNSVVEPVVEEPVVEEPEEPVVEPVVEEPVVEEPEEPVVEEPVADEKDARISELEAENEALKAEIEELKKKLDEPVAEPVDEELKNKNVQKKNSLESYANMVRALKK